MNNALHSSVRISFASIAAHHDMKMTVLFLYIYAKWSVFDLSIIWMCAMSKKQIKIDKGYFKDGIIFISLRIFVRYLKIICVDFYKDESIMWNPSVSLKKSFKMLFFASHLSDNVKRRWLRQSFSVASKKRTKYLKIKQKENFFLLIYMLHWIISPSFCSILLTFTSWASLSPFHFPTRISNSCLSLWDFVANIFPVFLSLFFACCAFLIIHTCSLNHTTIIFLSSYSCMCAFAAALFETWYLECEI